MRFLAALPILALISLVLVLLLSYGTSRTLGGLDAVVVPAYFYPTSEEFQRLLSVASPRVLVVLNVLNGPGSRFNYDYYRAVNALVERGAVPVGYVYTSYGGRDLKEVEEDVDRWYSFYLGIRGIFVDEVGSNLTYYVELYSYVKLRYGGLVILNPGTNFLPELAQYCDYVVVFEGGPQALRNFKLSPALQPYLSKLVFLVYGVSEAEFREVYSTILKLGARSLYITHDTLPNPWDTLSKYLPKLIES